MGNRLKNKKDKMHTGLSLEDHYVVIFDKIMKYLDFLGYKCVFKVKLKHPWVFDYDANKQYRFYYVVDYQFIEKDVDDVKALMPHPTDVYTPYCAKLNTFLYENPAFVQRGKDITDSRFYKHYVNVSLSEMFAMFRTPKKLFCSLFIPDILDCGIVIRDIRNWLVKQVIIKPKSTAEEALINIDMIIP